jgi:hypothetical protein
MQPCTLVCVDPAQIEDFLPHVTEQIAGACRRGLHDFEGSLRALRSGHAILWLAWDGEHILASATTELHRINGRKLCFIATLGGRNRDRWLGLISGIEQFARAETCESVIIMGRAGWSRALPEYRTRGLILERAL